MGGVTATVCLRAFPQLASVDEIAAVFDYLRTSWLCRSVSTELYSGAGVFLGEFDKSRQARRFPRMEAVPQAPH